jgi:hypothetical protein
MSRRLMLDTSIFSDDDPESGPALTWFRRSTGRKIYCKQCNRKDYHFLAIEPPIWAFCVKLMTLGTIMLYGPYRCCCCKTKRIGRFDFVRGRKAANGGQYERSSRSWRDSGDSWRGAQRRLWIRNMLSRLVPRRRRRKEKFGKKRFW